MEKDYLIRNHLQQTIHGGKVEQFDIQTPWVNIPVKIINYDSPHHPDLIFINGKVMPEFKKGPEYLPNAHIINNKEAGRIAVAQKYGKSPAEIYNPEVYFKNRQNEAARAFSWQHIKQGLSDAASTKDFKRMMWGIAVIGGVVTIVLSCGTGTGAVLAVFGVIEGSMSAIGGTTALVLDAAGREKDIEKVPFSYFGGMALQIEISTGNKSHTVSNIISLTEGMIALGPDIIRSQNSLSKFSNLERTGFSAGAILTADIGRQFFSQSPVVTSPAHVSTGKKLSDEDVKKIRSFINNIPEKAKINKL